MEPKPDRKWERFYSPFRKVKKSERNLAEELIENQLEIHGKETVDDSKHIVIVMDEDKWDDIVDFLSHVNAPIPDNVTMSPMHADTREMSNTLNTPLK